MSVWTKLDADFREFPIARGESATDEQIREAEARIGCVFSGQYRKFLRRYGSASVGPDPVFGVSPAKALGACWSVVEETNRYRDEGGWPGVDKWYVISGDGRGNPVGMDESGQVWVSDHDVGDVHRIAKSFVGYLKYQFKLQEEE